MFSEGPCKKVALFYIRLCGVNGDNQDAFDLQAVFQLGIGHCTIQIIGFLQEVKPMLRFGRLLQSNMKLRNKVCGTAAVLRLVDIRADRGAAAKNLL